MNKPIVRLYALVAVLFALLVAFTSRWTVFEAASLRNNPDNARRVLAQERIQRGEILAANGAVLAKSVRNREGIYERRYPMGSLFATPVGYFYPTFGSRGIEGSENEALQGQLGGGLQRLLNQLQGIAPGGDTVQTTLVPAAQRAAQAALAGREGAVVAIDPGTGAVQAMASSPSYDPNLMATAKGVKQVESLTGSPEFNHAADGGYAPGSTFKIVTATAALDTGLLTPESTLSGRNGILISGVPLDNDQDESFGEITLTKALAQSVNTVYAQVAERVGKPTMERYMQRFGFDAQPSLDLPGDEMSPSGEYFNNALTPPSSELVDLGRLGIGQDRLQATPLQMAMVAATVANHGTLMAPHLTRRVIDPEGGTVEAISPKVQSVVMKPSTAAEITKMMEAVVNEGTGTEAQIAGMPGRGQDRHRGNRARPASTTPGSSPSRPPANRPSRSRRRWPKCPATAPRTPLPVAKQVMEALLR